MAHRIACSIEFCLLPNAPTRPPLIGGFERPLCLGALSVFGGVLDSALLVGMYSRIWDWLDGLTNNQSIINYWMRTLGTAASGLVQYQTQACLWTNTPSTSPTVEIDGVESESGSKGDAQ